MKKIIPAFLSLLRSRTFFFIVVGLLVVQALWIACTARYPMAFDEDFHFGLIQIYSHQWTPFFQSAPPSSAEFGDLIRNPSYLYHYLFSFPYRLFSPFIHDQTVQIIILRILNIALFASGLFAFRALFRRLHISDSITNISLLMLILIPVVPFLAGQINYDNLLFLLVPITTSLTLICGQEIKRTGSTSAINIALLFILSMLSALVKYAFIPIFLMIILYLAIIVLRSRQKHRFLQHIFTSFTGLKLWLKIGLIVSLVVAGGLFSERYGVNIVEYRSLQPDCAKIESVDDCLQYGPWARNYIIDKSNDLAGDVPLDPEPPLFLSSWVTGIMHRLYFAINYDFINYYELPIPITTAYVVGIIGLALFLIFCRSILRSNYLLLLPVSIIIIYIASLLYINYTDYLHFKTMLAINGRYIIPILPLLFALLAVAYSRIFVQYFTTKRAATYKLIIASIVILLTLQGGGILTYAVRSDGDWYWPNPLANNLGTGLKNAVTPFIFGGNERHRSDDL